MPKTENSSSVVKELKIIKVGVRKFSDKLGVVRHQAWLDMENLKEEMRDEMALLRNDVAGMKDEVVTELKAIREEFTAHQGTHQRQQETLENYQKRIASLESQNFFSPLPSLLYLTSIPPEL
jgi:chromosome segregation ATPase